MRLHLAPAAKRALLALPLAAALATSACGMLTPNPAVNSPDTSAAKYSAPPRGQYPAEAPPYNPEPVVNVTLRMDDRQFLEVAQDTYVEAWTFNGSVPGPVIRVKQGARVNVRVINEGRHLHSVDFHSARTPISNYRNVMSGDEFTWSFVAEVPGVYMYHCGTPPALLHIGNGMYGVMIVDPDPPLARADHEYVLVQSEFYYGQKLDNGVITGDYTKMAGILPDIVTFNGHQSQYRDEPLRAEPGELVRFYVVDAGPTMNSAFHVVGEIFERVIANGNPAPTNITEGTQTALVSVGGGSIFEVRPKTAGDYLFVSHAFAQAAKGAVGVLRVGHAADNTPSNVDH